MVHFHSYVKLLEGICCEVVTIRPLKLTIGTCDCPLIYVKLPEGKQLRTEVQRLDKADEVTRNGFVKGLSHVAKELVNCDSRKSHKAKPRRARGEN